jgi:hypothetical protein
VVIVLPFVSTRQHRRTADVDAWTILAFVPYPYKMSEDRPDAVARLCYQRNREL